MRQFTSAFKRLAPAVLLLLAACGSQSGPIEIKYGRDACEMCGMIISSPRYVAEVRLAADKSVHKFDDVGDALNWLEKECKGLDGVEEVWVMDSSDGKTWLDARRAWYRRGSSPMNYNFAAVASQGEGAVDFTAMRAQVLRPRYACGASGDDAGHSRDRGGH